MNKDNLKLAVAEVFETHPTANQVYTTADGQLFLTLTQADSHASNMLDKLVLKHNADGAVNEITEADYNVTDLGKVPFDSEAPLDALGGGAIKNANKEAGEAALLKSLKSEYTELFGQKPSSFFKADGLIKAIADKKADLATGNEPPATGNEAESPQSEVEIPEENTQTTNPE